ncbi:hypothetical protein [Thiobacillus sp.]|jgi:hypothetical protein|uniref:hypothetical protein n=1 Tax=Thiobacillus sp. TaxID=924 RepID=UPI0025DBE4B6|nr:hypothetical protein [Thiobacillus sp.]
MLRKIRRLARVLLQSFPDQKIKNLAARLPRNIANDGHESAHVLVQCVADAYFLSVFSAIVNRLSTRKRLKVELVVTRSVESSFGSSLGTYIRRSFGYAFFLSRQWVNAYAHLGASVGYRSVGWGSPLLDLRALASSISVWRSLGDVSSLEGVHIGGILCGDLIIDTYLRFRPAAEINLRDPFLLYIIWQSARDIARARRYFRRNRPGLYLTSYSTYVQHGIAARVALESGVKVVAFGNLQQIGKPLSKDDFYHTKNPVGYRIGFAKRADREKVLEQAKAQLESRLGGGVDLATAYMARSAYADNAEECPDVTGAVVVFLHDFFDSPHVYPDLVFPEFWSWICFTIEALQADSTPFFLKPHPNQVGESADVIQRLIQKYPGVRLIPVSIPNSRLAKGGMRCALTVYGTVAHEMAYLGVPSITAARHPHIAFDFCKTAQTQTEYRQMLRSVQSLRLDDPEEAREQVLQFYVMHNLDEGDDAIAARQALVQLWKQCHAEDGSADDIIRALEKLTSTEGFRRFVVTLI